MIGHLVIWTWQPSIADDQVTDLIRRLRELTATIPSLVRYECGAALGLREGGDFGVLAITADAAGLDAYLDDPRHRHLAGTVIAKMAATRIAVQLALPDSFLALATIL